jgi:hypothetical protein
MVRKPIQIAVDAGRLFVLCDDGTIWWKGDTDDYWHFVMDLPDTSLDDIRIRTVTTTIG